MESSLARPAKNKTENRFASAMKNLARADAGHYFAKLFFRRGLVAQLVEQCPFNSKTPVLAIFGSFYFPFVVLVEALILLAVIVPSMASLGIS
jgi:hypothetical protein